MNKKSKNKKSKNKKIILFSIIMMLVLLSCMVIVINIIRLNDPEVNLEYINSDEMRDETFSPDMIHIVISKYEGNLNPKAISKSTYYFINTVVQRYLNNCVDEESTKRYFNSNADSIYIDIGIDSEDEFYELIQEIDKLNGKLEYENATFKMNEIYVNSNNTEAILYIKYKDNPEISVKTTISNRVYNNRSSIKYSK